MNPSSNTPWKECVSPIVRKCRLAASLNLNTTFNPDGADALAAVLEEMAMLIDQEIGFRSARDIAIAVIEGAV